MSKQPAPNAQVSRRKFLSRSAAAAGAGVALPYFIPRHVLAQPGKPGANDRVFCDVATASSESPSTSSSAAGITRSRIMFVTACTAPWMSRKQARIVVG